VSLKISRGANVLELSEMLAGSTGLEPAASGVTGRRQRPHIAADPGKSGSALPRLGRSRSIVDACLGTACKFLQAPARSDANGREQPRSVGPVLRRAKNRGPATNCTGVSVGPQLEGVFAPVFN
jgi:hypothetical protein